MLEKMKEKLYELRFRYYMKLKEENMSKARKHLFDDDLTKYKEYMENVRIYMWKIQNLTLDAEQKGISIKAWFKR